MLFFVNDYCEGAHPAILEKLVETNMEKLSGYGTDKYCDSAKEKIRKACGCPDAEVFFLVGGTPVSYTHLFWEAFCRGAYPGHGETYMNDEGILWWSHGGKLHGESPERFKFLQKIMEETPAPGLRPLENQWDEVGAAVDNSLQDIKYYIFYYSFMRPSFREYHIDDETEFEVEVIDTWNMTIEKKGIFKGKFRIDLPGREYMAVRVREVK